MTSPLPFRKQQQEPALDIPEGNLFRRMVTARVLSQLKRARVDDIAASLWPSDKTLATLISTRAATSPAMTSVTGWAAELAQKWVEDTVEALGAASAAVDVMTGGLVLTWNGYGAIGVPAFVATAGGASFVAEGQPIPVRQFAATAQSILPHKVAGISVLTREMVESSNAEQLIGDVLVRSAALALDAAFFDINPATAARPAGIRNGIAALTPSASTDPFGAYFEDLGTLIGAVSAVGGKGPYVLVGNSARVIGMSARFLGDDDAVIEPIMSGAVGSDIIAIASQAVASAISPDPEIEVASAAALVMDDTAPGLPGAAGPERSLFQTETLAIKVRWPVSWALRDPRGVAWLTPAWK
jgi:hypothetical protein